MTRFTAAVVQAATVGSDSLATLAKAEELIAECGRRGAEVAVFPEAFVGGYPKGADFRIVVGARHPDGREEYAANASRAIVVPGPETQRLGRAARGAKLYLVMGVIEREGGTLYCTALFFGPDGILLGKHRKTMPTAAERLCWGFGDGSTLTTVPTPWGALGAVICWETCRSCAWRCTARASRSTAPRPPTIATPGRPPCATSHWKDAASCSRPAST